MIRGAGFRKVAPFVWIGAGLGAVAYYIVTRGRALDEPPTGETVVRAQQPVD